jgi:SAM-dependent methyltransferase
VCGGAARRFRPYGIERRAEARCIHCGALERHRFAWLYLRRRTDLFDGRPKRMLHVAPERSFRPRLRALLGGGHVTADLEDPRASVRMDVTDIPFADGSFDVVYCSHVLEHVPDDRKAVREFRRVLRRGGWALIAVPITAGRTIEDPSVTSPAERLRRFGQEDHVRRYGPDYVERIRDAGFDVQVHTARDLFTGDEILTMGLGPASGQLCHCTGSASTA